MKNTGLPGRFVLVMTRQITFRQFVKFNRFRAFQPFKTELNQCTVENDSDARRQPCKSYRGFQLLADTPEGPFRAAPKGSGKIFRGDLVCRPPRFRAGQKSSRLETATVCWLNCHLCDNLRKSRRDRGKSIRPGAEGSLPERAFPSGFSVETRLRPWG